MKMMSAGSRNADGDFATVESAALGTDANQIIGCAPLVHASTRKLATRPGSAGFKYQPHLSPAACTVHQRSVTSTNSALTVIFCGDDVLSIATSGCVPKSSTSDEAVRVGAVRPVDGGGALANVARSITNLVAVSAPVASARRS